jgi:hypothetical protein
VAETFSDWLALREPVDFASRSSALTLALLDALPPRAPLHVLDLGTGTGSNVRYLMPQLPSPQRWTLIDHDADLLAEIPRRLAAWADAAGYGTHTADDGLWIRGDRLECRIETRPLDLRNLDRALVAGHHLVTGSALLDLVSDRWLQDLAAACGANRAAVLFALTYSGDTHCTPPEPEDDDVTALMNRHQHGDKGFGPAAGPEAAERAVIAFEQAGYVVQRARSDWHLESDRAPLQTSLFEGWQRVAAAMAPDDAASYRDWLARRLAHLAAGRSQIVVSHEDLAAWPKRD